MFTLPSPLVTECVTLLVTFIIIPHHQRCRHKPTRDFKIDHKSDEGDVCTNVLPPSLLLQTNANRLTTIPFRHHPKPPKLPSPIYTANFTITFTKTISAPQPPLQATR